MTAPSPHRVEQAMSVAQSTMARLAAEGTINPETDEAALLATLGEEGADIQRILRRFIAAALEADAFADAAKARIDAVAERRARYQRQHEAYRGAAFAIMDALGLKRVEDAEFTATIGKPRVQCVVTDETEIPDRYFETVRKLRRGDLADDVKAGVVVPGAELTNGLPSLTIRRT